MTVMTSRDRDTVDNEITKGLPHVCAFCRAVQRDIYRSRDIYRGKYMLLFVHNNVFMQHR
jgi:hypothetical protein